MKPKPISHLQGCPWILFLPGQGCSFSNYSYSYCVIVDLYKSIMLIIQSNASIQRHFRHKVYADGG